MALQAEKNIAHRFKLLILAGTNEARTLIDWLSEQPALLVFASYLAPPKRAPKGGAILTIGGFGGDSGFLDFLTSHKINAVIDATHPFAAIMGRRAAKICQQIDIPCLKILRPAWKQREGDRWISVEDTQGAAKAIPAGAVVFIGSGRKGLSDFRHLDARFYCRQLDPPTKPFPFAKGAFLQGIPPFSAQDEARLFTEKAITHLVSKNAGGTGGYAKIEAARMCKIPVIMIARGEESGFAPIVETIEEAYEWAVKIAVAARAPIG